MKRDEWAYLGFGFGTAVVLGLAAWGAIELTKKIVAKHREKACPCGCEDEEAQEGECCDGCDEEGCDGCEDECGDDCDDECCDDESCEDGCCCCGAADGDDSSKESGDDIVEKSVNAQDEVLSSEFGSKSEV